MYNYLTSAFPPSVCGMLRLTVRFQRITHISLFGSRNYLGDILISVVLYPIHSNVLIEIRGDQMDNCQSHACLNDYHL
jgi:hypothetical protein